MVIPCVLQDPKQRKSGKWSLHWFLVKKRYLFPLAYVATVGKKKSRVTHREMNKTANPLRHVLLSLC